MKNILSGIFVILFLSGQAAEGKTRTHDINYLDVINNNQSFPLQLFSTYCEEQGEAVYRMMRDRGHTRSTAADAADDAEAACEARNDSSVNDHLSEDDDIAF